MKHSNHEHVLTFVLGVLALTLTAQAQEPPIQQLYERVFGDAVKLDPAMVAKVKEEEAGKRHYVDANGDGTPEEVWFIDLAKRHADDMRPVLVRVIDEDGDLRMGDEPDLDGDLYLADWHADGVVNVVCDYTDTDEDGDVDEMALYFPKKDRVMVWWGEDVGDDNLLWFDTGYTYRQPTCQFRTHFGGDELFSAFTLGLNDAEWVPAWENPFVFYDHDHDGMTEEVVRIEGEGPLVRRVRHSFDVDDDATPEEPHDYDVSITGHVFDDLAFDERYEARRSLRGIPTGGFLSFETAAQFSRETPWQAVMMTWVENDHNIDRDQFADGHERWEGVIAKGNEQFKQVGGPSCGPLNNRFEMTTAAKGPVRVYYSPTDQRIHLKGAEKAWLDVDADYDQKGEMRYTYEDANGDGYIDVWHFDANADGTVDDSWERGDTAVTEIGYTWGEMNAIMAGVLQSAPERLFGLTARLRQALSSLGTNEVDSVWQLLDSGFAVEQIPIDVRERYLKSNECLRYCFDVLKDRLIVALKARHDNAGFWSRLDAVRSSGDIDGMRAAVEETFGLKEALPAFEAWRAEKLGAYARPQVAWGQDWVPPNIGWESELTGYRAYWGQFDFFGKTRRCLIIPTLPKADASYHAEQEWGMDALHVGNTCGLGGVTLYVNGQPFPVYSPNGKGDIVWSKRLVAEESERVTVELVAEHVGLKENPYTVRFQCSALANRKDSPIEVIVEGGAPGMPIELGVGLTKLRQEKFALDTQQGIMANWGVQEPAIGTIGMGIVFPTKRFIRIVDLPEERQVILAAELGKPVRYHIQGDWLRGRRFPFCPTLTNWMEDLGQTAETAKLDE